MTIKKSSDLKKIYVIYILMLMLIALYIYITGNNEKYNSIEELDIPIAIGYDIKSDKSNIVTYSIPISVYDFSQSEGEGITTIIHEGEGNTIAETRENRQMKSNRKFILGTEKVVLISEEFANKGIKGMLDILFNDSFVNDRALMAIVKPKSRDVLELKIKGYPSSGDYIEGLIKNVANYNFFPDNYKIYDAYERVDSEGRQLVLPYIDVKNGIPEIIGTALFNKGKISSILNLNESKTMNILRENKVKGIVNIIKKSGENTSLYTRTKKKVTCKKEGDKYNFFITLNLKGNIIENNIYKGIENNPAIMKELEREVEEQVKIRSDYFINKMKKDYKIDCLELGRIASAKYGKRKNIDWNNVICNSNIYIKVNFNLDKTGRGIH